MCCIQGCQQRFEVVYNGKWFYTLIGSPHCVDDPMSVSRQSEQHLSAEVSDLSLVGRNSHVRPWGMKRFEHKSREKQESWCNQSVSAYVSLLSHIVKSDIKGSMHVTLLVDGYKSLKM